MTVQARLTLWYGAVLVVSLAIMAGVLYNEWTEQQLILREQKTPLEAAWEEVGEIILFYGIPTTLLLLVGGWWLVRSALAPVRALTQAAERIQVHSLKERLPSSGKGDELDRLTEVFNAMTTRLDHSFTQIREFTLHASHELKTPLTLMQAEIETAMRENTIPGGQRELFFNQLDEIQRLAKIVDGLTLLAKADAGQVALQMQPVQLHQLVQDSFEDAKVLAQCSNIAVNLRQCDPVTVRGDRHRLRQLLLNLTENAIKYNHSHGYVDLALIGCGDSATLRIANTGPGISTETLPRIFDRFFRGDPAHSHSIEGCGLGLSIVQWIVSAHGGRIEVASEPNQLTSFTVHLPRANNT